MTDYDYKKQAQEYYAQAPVIILGSGASMAFSLPGMSELAEYIKSNMDVGEIPAEQTGNWSEFCGLLDTGTDLEAALHHVNFSEEMTGLIVSSAWELISQRDNEAYEKSLLDSSLFPLGKLITHMFRSSLNTLNIITTNYDCLAEYACDQEGTHYYTGFSTGYTRRLCPPNHIKCARTVNIWKVHGSLDWFCSEWGETISISKPKLLPDSYRPQIVTPGIQKYQKTHLEPYRTIIGSADSALETSNSYLCFGFGFNDEHIQPKLLAKCERNNASITVVTYALTEQAKKLLFSGRIANYLAIERGDSDTQSRIYSSLHKDSIVVDANYWSMGGFTNLIM